MSTLGKHWKLSEKTREKYREKTKLLWQNPDYRKHMSEIHKGMLKSEETKDKMSKSHKGKKPYIMTEKIKNNISKSVKLFYQRHPERREEISISKKGKRHFISKETRQKIGNSNKGKIFSEEAKQKSSATKQGISFSEWKDFITPYNERERKKTEIRLWKKSCMERDNFTCQACGEHGGKLEIHHIFNFADYLEKRTEIANGITLCQKCHQEFHKIYGKRNNTKEQLEEFLNHN